MDHDYVEIDGHRVDPRKLDRFYHGDGRRVTDEEWDEDRRRAIAGLAGEDIVGLDIRDTPPTPPEEEQHA
jgi:hypothetical protein